MRSFKEEEEQHARCNMLDATCNMQDARCKVQDARMGIVYVVRGGVKDEERSCGERLLRLHEALTSRSSVLGALRF